MKKLALLLILLNVSCDGIGQEKVNIDKKKYDQTYRFIGSYGDSLNFKPRKKIYKTYITVGKDTVLLTVQEYKYFDKQKDTIISDSYPQQKKLSLSDSTFIVEDSGELFLITESNTKYSLLDKVKYETETFYDDFGEAHEAYFPASEIEPFKDNQYIVIYYQEGGYKIGIFEVNREGFTKKFLSKGCLFYDEWSEFDFFFIKDDKIILNYLTIPEGEEIGQVELNFENGEYSLNLNQCE